MKRKKKLEEPQAVPFEERVFTPEELKDMVGSPGVPQSDRQGVFVHSFKCFGCGLHFNLYSWQRNRHRVGQVGCPECGERTKLAHWRATVNEHERFGVGGTEIYNLCEYPGAQLLDDSWREGPR